MVSLDNSRFEAPDGTPFERDVVRHPGAVVVVPVHDNGDVVLVSQYRAPIDSFVIEIPAGKRDVPGEAPELTAGRELEEEVGLIAGRLELLSTFHNSIGFCDEECHVFLGQALTSTEVNRDGLEEAYMDIITVPLSKSLDMISSGEITDSEDHHRVDDGGESTEGHLSRVMALSSSTVQLSAQVAEFLLYLSVEKGRSDKTLEAYTRDLRRYTEFLAGRARTVENAQPEDLFAFAAHLPLLDRPLAPASVARTMVSVRTMHRFLVVEGLRVDDPAVHLENPTLPSPLPRHFPSSRS